MIDDISNIARLAGIEILKIYNGYSKLNIYKKMDQSPVTNADLSAHQVIEHSLKNLTPNIPILSEEKLPEWNICKNWICFWLIDPLDGTKEFLMHNGEFTVNIALIDHGQPVMGVVYLPVYNVLYASSNGKAWKISSCGRYDSISVKKSNCPVIVMSRTNFQYNKKKFSNCLKNFHNYKIMGVGSSLKFCLVADGSAQLYPRFSVTKIWDTAAGHAIAVSAGAMIKDWKGNSLHYRNINQFFLNPEFQVFSSIEILKCF